MPSSMPEAGFEIHDGMSQPPGFVRDSDYYCPDVVFVVEGTLFRVPRVVLSQSYTFCDRYFRDRCDMGGMDDTHPLRLEGIMASEFRAFLRVLFPLQHGTPATLAVEDIIPVLKLATLWNFAFVRAWSIDALAPYANDDPILKIVVAQKHRVIEWLVPGLNALARREQALTPADVARMKALGNADVVMDLVLKIAYVRESFVSWSSLPSNTPIPDFTTRISCFNYHPCHHHRVSTKCAGLNNKSDRPIRRGDHDFTNHICETFNLQLDGQSTVVAQEDEEAATTERARCLLELQQQQEAERQRSEDMTVKGEWQEATAAAESQHLPDEEAEVQRSAGEEAVDQHAEAECTTAEESAPTEGDMKRVEEAEVARTAADEAQRLVDEKAEADRVAADQAAYTAAQEAAAKRAADEETARKELEAEDQERQEQEAHDVARLKAAEEATALKTKLEEAEEARRRKRAQVWEDKKERKRARRKADRIAKGQRIAQEEAERKRREAQEAARAWEEAEAAATLQRQAKAKAEKERLALAEAARQAEEEKAKAEAEVLRKKEEARETARLAAEAEAEAERQRLALEESKRLAEAELARVKAEAEEAERKRLEEEEKRKAEDVEAALAKAEQEEVKRLRLAEEQRKVGKATKAMSVKVALPRSSHANGVIEEKGATGTSIPTRPLSNRRTPFRTGAPSTPTPLQPPTADSAPELPPAPPRLGVKAQAKMDAPVIKLAAAQRTVDQATVAAKPPKHAATRTARRKAVASAKPTAPRVKMVQGDIIGRDAAHDQVRLDAFQSSFAMPTPTASVSLAADAPTASSSSVLVNTSLDGQPVPNGRAMHGLQHTPATRSIKSIDLEPPPRPIRCLNSAPAPDPPPPRTWVNVVSVSEREAMAVDSGMETFRIVCYNILCDRLATEKTYGYTATWALKWDYRKGRILEELLSHRVEFICLQEVDVVQYKEFFSPKLRDAGYYGVYYPKSRYKTMNESSRRTVDGCATFFLKAKYTLVEGHLLEFRGMAMARSDFTKTEDIFNRVMNRDHIGVVCLFEAVATGTRLIVANTHLFWDPAFRDVKLVQTGLLCEQLERIAHEFAAYPPRLPVPGAHPPPVYTDGSSIPLVLCGDFNSVPGSGVVDLLATGAIPPGHADWMHHRYGVYTDEGVHHGLALKNAYDSVPLGMTNYTPSFRGVLDYIFFGGQTLAVNAVLGEVDNGYLATCVGFPNAAFPSDHVCIAAELRVPPPHGAPGGDAAELELQAAPKTEEERLALAEAARQAEEEKAKADAEFLRKDEEARETARLVAEAEAERQRMALEQSQRLAEAELARVKAEAEEAERKRLEEEEKRKAEDVEAALAKAEREEAERQRLAEKQCKAGKTSGVTAADVARGHVDEMIEEKGATGPFMLIPFSNRRTPFRTSASSTPAPLQPSTAESAPEFAPELPRLDVKAQAKMDALVAQLEAAQRTVGQATVVAKSWKDAATADEEDVDRLALLMERPSVLRPNVAEKVRTARWKAIASAKLAASRVKVVEDAIVRRDAAQTRLDTFRLSIAMPVATVSVSFAADVSTASPSNILANRSMDEKLVPNGRVKHHPQRTPATHLVKRTDLEPPPKNVSIRYQSKNVAKAIPKAANKGKTNRQKRTKQVPRAQKKLALILASARRAMPS